MIQTERMCEPCTNSLSGNDLHPNTKLIGSQVLIEPPKISGAKPSDFIFSQCLGCGSIWAVGRDGQTADRSLFIKCLTLGLF